MTPLALATESERTRYSQWLERIAKNTRGRMGDWLWECARVAKEAFYG